MSVLRKRRAGYDCTWLGAHQRAVTFGSRYTHAHAGRQAGTQTHAHARTETHAHTRTHTHAQTERALTFGSRCIKGPPRGSLVRVAGPDIAHDRIKGTHTR
jgi:transposase